MRYLISSSFIVVLLLTSCNRMLYDIDYHGESNYKGFYLVDTIVIKDPVRIYSEKFGGMFVLSGDKLKEYRNDINFLLEPDVFILGFDLYRDLDKEDYVRYNYVDNGGCDIQKADIDVDGLECYNYPENTKFLLGLINTNHYHIKHNSPEYFSIPIKNSKITFHKIVYPLCQ